MITGGGLLWATRVLEVKWLVALLAGWVLLWVGFVSGRFERYMLCLLFLAIPVNVDIHFDLGVSLYAMQLPTGTPRLGISVMDIVLCFLYPAWLFRIVLQRRVRSILWPRGASIFLCFMAWCAVSMLNAENLRLSIFFLVGLLKVFLLFFYVANNVRTRDDLWLVAKCLVVGLVVEGFIACAQQIAGGNLGLNILGERQEVKEVALKGETIFRVGGTLSHPNFLGGYLTTLLPVALALAVAHLKKVVNVIMTGSFVLGVVVLILTFSRSAWLMASAACLLFMGLFLLLRRKSLPVLPILLLAAIMAIVLVPFGPQIKSRMLEDDKGAAASRFPQNKLAWAMIKSHPILGVGLNNSGVVSHLYETYMAVPTERGRVYLYKGRVHNVYLALASEVGLVGLGWFLWFLWIVTSQGWHNVKSAKDPLVQLILLGMLLGFGGRTVHEALHTGNLITNGLLWVYSALLVTTIEVRRD
jgi:hypothetical protein